MNTILIIKKILKYIYNFKARKTFKQFGRDSIIYWPAEVCNGKYMIIGDNCYIKKYAWLHAIKVDKDPIFIMGNNSYINRNCQIVITQKVIIGNHVAIADNVYIADTTHEYHDITKPTYKQPLVQIGEVQIGDGSWIGRNAAIMGCKIGKNCVIGYNSFVTKDIPDYCIVAGCPAKIIKRYNLNTQKWEKTDENGNFLNS